MLAGIGGACRHCGGSGLVLVVMALAGGTVWVLLSLLSMVNYP